MIRLLWEQKILGQQLLMVDYRQFSVFQYANPFLLERMNIYPDIVLANTFGELIEGLEDGLFLLGYYPTINPCDRLKHFNFSKSDRFTAVRIKVDFEREKHSIAEIMVNHLLQRITLHQDICHGKPCIRGLRYPVEFILELLSSGMTIEEILADYDDLEAEDIQAVLLFAARLSQVKSIHKIAS
jgi:uncharacterized protein (DUF433 family)